jgi:hypothetical protein
MSAFLSISNDGPLITATDYFEAPHATVRGLAFCSINAGAFRLLLPSALESAIPEMMTGRYCIVTRGWHSGLSRKMLEFLFEDGSQSPYVIHIEEAQCDRVPDTREDAMRSDLTLSIWVAGEANGRPPVMAVSMPARYRAAPLPCLKPWPEGGPEDGR